MSIDLTPRTLRALEEISIEPNISMVFEGLDVIFSNNPVQEFVTINCPGFFIGAEGFFIGGLKDIEPERNRTLIDDSSVNQTIRQQINHHEGSSSSISNMNIGLVDKDGYVTELISPGIILPDVMGRKVQVFVTVGRVSFFEDAFEIFKGFVTHLESFAGKVKFKVNHPDNKKKVDLFKSVSTKITALMNATQTTLDVADASSFFEPSGPMSSYLRINEEVIEYTGVAGNTVTGLVRGSLGSTAAPHDLDDQIKPLYALEGNPLNLAMEIMMSGHGTDPIYEGIEISSFLQIGAGVTQIANAVYFDQKNIPRKYGLRQGDTVTITGATNGANNVTLAVVDDVVSTDSGYYVVLAGTSLVLEQVTTAVMATFTQFNTLPDGMRMTPDEVDIDEHEQVRDFFHSSVEMRLFLKEDKIEGKEFLEKQLYQPIACYSLPRKAKSSVGYTIGPIPGENIETIDITSVKDPTNMRIVRSQAKAFFNEVVYKYDDTPLIEDEKFVTGKVYISQTSKNRIPGANRTYTVESLGLRTDLAGESIATINSQRILDRYEFIAEIFYCSVLFRVGAGIEVGDIVIGDLKELQVSDITRGDRQFKPRLFEVLNKSMNLKTGHVDFAILDTGINIDARFGLISPCSTITGVISQSQFVLGPDPDEYIKWSKIVNSGNPMSILIRDATYTVTEDLVVTSIDENTFTLQSPATITLTAGLMVEFTIYEDADVSDKQKLVYGFMNDNPTFLDGENQYTMI